MAIDPDQNTEQYDLQSQPEDPTWVPRLAVEAAHHEQLLEHGGLRGIRDKNALEAALARPRQRRHYDPHADLAALAAAYTFGIATSHPFADGNKRTAYVTTEMFLALNGYTVNWPDAEVVEMMLALAAKEIGEDAFASWLRTGLVVLP